MIIRGARIISRLAVLFAAVFTFTACGGGGGGDTFYDGDSGSQGQSEFSFTLLDPQGNRTNTVTSSAPGTLKVGVKGGGANIVVSATADQGTLFPASGTALTDNSGTATFQLEAGTEKGAGIINASATFEEKQITGTFGYNVGESGLRLGYFDADGTFIENQILVKPATTLAAGGNAQLSVTILDSDGNRVGTAETVRFNSGCIAGNQATISPELPESINAEASTLYTTTGCAGIDRITASLIGASAQAFADLNIAPRETNSIDFISAVPALIVLKGTGGQNREESSTVVFRIVDGAGVPLQGVSVDFSLTTNVGGLQLSKSSALSDGNGEVAVTVQAGDVATTVRVLATVNDGSGNPVSTVSDLLTVTTGLPDQNSISLSVDSAGGFMVAEGFVTDGLCRTLTVRMADKFNNPVVDGTAATFTTEYGVIVSSCTTTDGSCSVEWCSSEPRYPTLTGPTFVKTVNDGANCPCPEDLGYIRGGRSTITVRAQGEESFIDRNGNGIMDEAERDLFENLPEAFTDYNEDGVYTVALPQCQGASDTLQCIAGQEEQFFDYNDNQIYDLNDDPPLYNGLLCPPEGNGIWCSRELVDVRADTVVTMLTPLVAPSFVGSGGNYSIRFSDFFNNPPSSGSTVSISANDGCTILGETSFTVPTLFFQGAYVVSVATAPTGGTFTATLAPTAGANASVTLACTPAPPPEPEAEGEAP